MKIYGIPCRLKSPKLRRAIRIVLGQIRRRAPEDFGRIRTKVRSFVPEPKREIARGALGSWKAARGGAASGDFDSPGSVRVAEDCSFPLAMVAHELGHACTREDDFSRRDGVDSEWASEMCADHYAYKWGFGREIARHRKHRDFGHHGPGPGTIFTIGPMPKGSPDEGKVYRYRVTRRFYIHLIQTEMPDGQVVETAAQIDARRRREAEELHRKYHPEKVAGGGDH